MSAVFILVVLRASADYLLAVGFSLIFGAGRVLNLAHGSIFLLSAFAAGLIATVAPPLVAFTGALVVGAAVAGGLHAFVLRPVRGDTIGVMVRCLAVNLLVTEGLRAIVGPAAVQVPPIFTGNVMAGDLLVSSQRAMAFPAALTVAGLYGAWLHLTRAGLALRGVANAPQAAVLVGIPADRTLRVAFLLSGATAGLAGGLLAPELTLGPTGWAGPLTRAFAVVVLGGAGTVRGPLMASVLLAATEVGVGAVLGYGPAELTSLGVLTIGLLVRGGRVDDR